MQFCLKLCQFSGTKQNYFSRLLKIFRSLRRFKKLQIILKALVKSLKSLGKPIILLVLILMIYGGLLIQIMKGKLEFRCRYTNTPLSGDTIWPIVVDTNYLCGSKQCPSGTYCRSTYEHGLSFEYSAFNQSQFSEQSRPELRIQQFR